MCGGEIIVSVILYTAETIQREDKQLPHVLRLLGTAVGEYTDV